MVATVDNGDIVRAVNTGDLPFTIGWDSRQYKLEPGKDTFIPFEAACLWFGDPRSSNSIQSIKNQHGMVSFVPDRDSEVRRLRVKYGNIGGDERFVDPGPSVDLYDLEGNQITTVLDDPEGDDVTVATPTITDQNSLVEMVARQQRQIEFLLGKMGLQTDDGDITQGLDEHGDPIEDTDQGEDGEGGEGGEDVETDDDGLPVDPSANS